MQGKIDTMNYDVYMWRDGAQKLPYAMVMGNKYTLKIASLGTYNVQVQSVDGSYKSKVRKIKVMDKNAEIVAGKETNGVADVEIPGKALSMRIKVRSPGRNLVWYGKGAWPKLLFEWDRPETCARDMKYQFVVENSSGKKVFTSNLQDEDFYWTPPLEFSGSYRWRVDGLSCTSPSGAKITQITSTPPRRLTLLRDDIKGLMEKAVADGNFRGTIFIDSL
jgi:hypothetical protein